MQLTLLQFDRHASSGRGKKILLAKSPDRDDPWDKKRAKGKGAAAGKPQQQAAARAHNLGDGGGPCRDKPFHAACKPLFPLAARNAVKQPNPLTYGTSISSPVTHAGGGAFVSQAKVQGPQ